MVISLRNLIFLCIFVIAGRPVCNHGVFAKNLESKHHALPLKNQQWFTGALLTPNAKTVPPGPPALEAVLVVSQNYGRYNHDWKLHRLPVMWGIAPYVDFQASFNNVVGIELIGSIITNVSCGETFTHLQDTIFRLGFQISNDKADTWTPDFKVLIQEVFPTGKYQNLNPKKNGADLTGIGSFQTGAHVVIQKKFNCQGCHPFRFRADIGYLIPTTVSVQGLNYYGGAANTKVKVRPGKYLTSFIFGELSLTKKCSVALEFNYQHGWMGKISNFQGAKMNVHSFNMLTALPELQYCLTEKIGLILGGWFSLTGKNATAFRGGEIALLILF